MDKTCKTCWMTEDGVCYHTDSSFWLSPINEDTTCEYWTEISKEEKD